MELKLFHDGIEVETPAIYASEVKQYANDSKESLRGRFKRKYTVKTFLNTISMYTPFAVVALPVLANVVRV